MFKPTLQNWVWSGIDKTSSENFNPTRITNIIALLCIFVSSLHVPIVLYFIPQSGYLELLLIIVSASLLTLVPLFNVLKFYLMSKLFLVTVFATYILISCLMRLENLNIQYFFLLAVVICPFLFKEAESGLMFLITLSFFLLFVGFECWFYYSSVNTLSFHQQIVKVSCSISFALSCLLCSYHIRRNINRNWQKLATERERSERLLLNILPLSIAQRLKNSSDSIADYFEKASILFADIQNFTPLCKKLSPRQLVDLLNEVFCEFDTITQKYGLEKIKTSGDGYMVAGGLPTINSSHAVQCCYCALDMRDAFKKICKKHNLHTGLRIGIGCGEVIAGIIGKSKFSYDLWGEAVNLASRMESHGLSNKIQVTESTYEMTKNDFHFDNRGLIEAKGLGWINTYWLLSRKNNLGTYVLAK
ncbi:MAG: adenylate cyclase [Flavobacteriales bacterium]|jgi:guanylate cyclase